MGCAMSDEYTTVVIKRHLDELAGDSPVEPIVRPLLDPAVCRPHRLWAALLHRSDPRLTPADAPGAECPVLTLR
jgi:hypothetical protein